MPESFGNQELPAPIQPAIPSNDHDTLVQIWTLFFELRNEIRASSNTIQATLAEHSKSIRYLEDWRTRLDLEKKINEYDSMTAWTLKFRERWKVYASFIAIGVSFLSALIARALTK